MTQPTVAILQQLDHAGPFRLCKGQDAPLIQAAAELAYPLFQVIPIEANNTAAWLTSLGQTLAFPEHFGANFDALYDCLSDPDWLPDSPGAVLILGKLDALGEEDVDILIAVLQAAADDHRERGRPLWAFLDAPGLDLDSL